MSLFPFNFRRAKEESRVPSDTPVVSEEIQTPSNQQTLSTTKRLPLQDIHQEFKPINKNLPSFIHDPNYSAPTLYDIIFEACDFYAEQIKCNSSHSQFYNNTNLFLEDIKSSCKILKKQMQEKTEEIKNRLVTINEEEKKLSTETFEIMKNLEILYKTNPDEVECDERIALTDSMIKE